MALIASNLSNVAPSPIFKLSSQAKALKAKGIEIFDFGIGEPDFDTPENIKLAAYAAIKSGKTKYTDVSGIKELKEAIIQKYSNRLPSLNVDNVVISAGAKQVIFNALFATISDGSEVIIPAPYWPSYIEMVKLCNGVPVVIECDEDSRFKLTPEKLQNAITEKTKWVIINSPNNPTGVKYSKEEFNALLEVIDKYPDLYVLSDDIYEDIYYDGNTSSIIDCASHNKDRIFIVHGVSKSYAMTGWRIGYGIGDADLIKAISLIQSQTTSSPCSVSQYAALEALVCKTNFLQDSVKTFSERLNRLTSLLETIPSLSFIKPQGAFYIFVNCKKCIGKRTSNGEIIKNDSDLCKYILEEAKAIVVPGSVFGAEGFFRISYATSMDVIEKGVRKFADAIGRLI